MSPDLAPMLARGVTPEVEVLHGARLDPDHERRDTGWVFTVADGVDDVYEADIED
ncbi:hypothetical protein [Nocardioides nitrophenolicus]|uniref:hypothetical protein n=1 Tax=Nocardioides nitrophenolicus TaxID=60489 RepID=UPI00195607E3|nr:hypothetical protein [Nocardioides nitrophenolicus]MBM7520262.1 hypothetical protein [Nocardioides nitrophenolicus]